MWIAIVNCCRNNRSHLETELYLKDEKESKHYRYHYLGRNTGKLEAS